MNAAAFAPSGTRTARAVALLLAAVLSLPTSRADPLPAPRRPDGHRTPVDPGIASYDPDPPMEGDLYIGGGMPCSLVDQWVQIFHRAHPGVRVHTAIYSGASAYGQLIEGPTQVCLMTREFLPYEEQFLRLKTKRPLPLMVPVAGGGYSSDVSISSAPSQVILVNKANPVPGLTLAQLDAIFSKTRKRGYKEDINRWGQVGLTGEWADKAIHVYNPSMPDGVPNFFRVAVMKGGEFKDGNQSQYEHPGVLRSDPYAICLGKRGSGHVEEKRDPDARIVPIAEKDGGPFLTGTYEEVLNRTYPLSRLFYLVVKTPPGKPVDRLAREFIRVALSKEGQYEVARTLYMPLPASIVRESLAKIE